MCNETLKQRKCWISSAITLLFIAGASSEFDMINSTHLWSAAQYHKFSFWILIDCCEYNHWGMRILSILNVLPVVLFEICILLIDLSLFKVPWQLECHPLWVIEWCAVLRVLGASDSQAPARSRPDGAGSSAHDWASAGITSSGPAVSVTSARCGSPAESSSSSSSVTPSLVSVLRTWASSNKSQGRAATWTSARVFCPGPAETKHWPGESSSGDSGPVSLSHLACRYDSSCLISRYSEYRAQGGLW
jgi:hypothetical protein